MLLTSFRPNPSIDELEEASLAFCSLPWSEIHKSHQNNSHEMTSDDKLPNRCVEALYITTLLEDGFGFRGTHRGITLALEVDGKEVEWTLGFALAEECRMNQHSRTLEYNHSQVISSEEQKLENNSNIPKTENDEIKDESVESPISEEEEEGQKLASNSTFFSRIKSLTKQKLSLISSFFHLFQLKSLTGLITKTFTILSQRIQFTINFLFITPLKTLLRKSLLILDGAKNGTISTVQFIRKRVPQPQLVWKHTIGRFFMNKNVTESRSTTSYSESSEKN